jgi:hypothetical protein
MAKHNPLKDVNGFAEQNHCGIISGDRGIRDFAKKEKIKQNSQTTQD